MAAQFAQIVGQRPNVEAVKQGDCQNAKHGRGGDGTGDGGVDGGKGIGGGLVGGNVPIKGLDSGRVRFDSGRANKINIPLFTYKLRYLAHLAFGQATQTIGANAVVQRQAVGNVACPIAQGDAPCLVKPPLLQNLFEIIEAKRPTNVAQHFACGFIQNGQGNFGDGGGGGVAVECTAAEIHPTPVLQPLEPTCLGVVV